MAAKKQAGSRGLRPVDVGDSTGSATRQPAGEPVRPAPAEPSGPPPFFPVSPQAPLFERPVIVSATASGTGITATRDATVGWRGRDGKALGFVPAFWRDDTSPQG